MSQLKTDAAPAVKPAESTPTGPLISHRSAPVFIYKYPLGFPAAEQKSLEAARLKANLELEGKAIASYIEDRAARVAWLWQMLSAYAAAIGRIDSFSPNQKRKALDHFASKAARAVHIRPWALSRLGWWNALEGAMFQAPTQEQSDATAPGKRGPRGPSSDDVGHKRVAELLADKPNWDEDLGATCALLAKPHDGKPGPDISPHWRKKYNITSYAEVFELIGDKEIQQHVQRRIEKGRLLAEDSRKLSETLGSVE
jgi:hypothetical protein